MRLAEATEQISDRRRIFSLGGRFATVERVAAKRSADVQPILDTVCAPPIEEVCTHAKSAYSISICVVWSRNGPRRRDALCTARRRASGVTPVAFGCGPGWTRGPYGGCHPMGYVAPGARVYGYYGYHPYAHPYYGRCWWRAGVRVCT